MLKLEIEGQERPLGEKPDFFIVTDDADGELATLIQMMEEYSEEDAPFEFEQVVRKATDDGGTWKMQMPDDETAELIELFEAEYPQVMETLGVWQQSVLRRIEEEQPGD
jgi:hypothetical protein